MDIQKGVIGFTFLARMTSSGSPIDISDASIMEIHLRCRGGIEKVFDAEFETDGTDGRLRYITEDATDLDTQGEWKAQPYIETLYGAFKGFGSKATFRVLDNLPDSF